MVNLLPPIAKKTILREYWLRVVTVAAVAVTASMLLLIVLQLPSYILLTGQLRGYQMRYQNAQSEKDSLKQAEDTVRSLNALAEHLDNATEETKLSTYVLALEALSGDKIQLSYFAAERNTNGQVAAVTIRGAAADRTALADFSEVVANDPLFVEAPVPIGNLAKDKNIDFELSVKVAHE